ncbi:M23 family metallopeptidase [Patescibacteria group bacterium]
MNKIIRTSLVFLGLFLFFLFLSKDIYAKWYYPMDKYFKRQTVKGFGDYIDDNFYKGKEKLFPYNRFYGYHAATDLEVNSSEIDKKVPVYAVSSGTITYIGTLSGYGGVILEELDNENNTVLYGHVKIKNLSIKVGDHIRVENDPVILTYLGDQFSSETSKERKHLHFGVYKGTDLYFKGHESSLNEVEKKWYDPNKFLKEKEAWDPIPEPIPTAPIKNTNDNLEEKKSFVYLFISFIKQLIKLQ